jgi:hypothetical protein
MRKYMMAIDHSWESVIDNYENVYRQIVLIPKNSKTKK